MSLLARLRGTEDPKLHVHQFQAALHQWQDGGMTRQQVLDAFSITVSEETQLDQVKTLFQDAVDKIRFRKTFDDLLLLAEDSIPPFDSNSAILNRLSDVSAGL